MRIALAFVLMVVSSIASAQCVGRHGVTGQPVQVYEAAGPTMGNAYAIANWAPNGWPSITYGPRFFALPPLQREFIKFHECAHVSVPTMDEIQANCIALVEMRRRGLSAQQEQQIAQWTASEGVVGFQYGGSGANFWLYTVQCAGSR